MGNRAFITDRDRTIGIYLHWNGGRDSVEAFLEYCKLKGCRGFGVDTSYAVARLAQVVGNFFGGTLSVGIETQPCYDDNGVYIVQGWEIVDRLDWDYEEEKEVPYAGYEQRYYPLDIMLEDIDEAQPESERLGDFLKAKVVKTSKLAIGDKVYLREVNESYKQYKVVGFGKNEYIDGTNVYKRPIVNRYLNDGSYRDNINNYLTEDEVYKA